MPYTLAQQAQDLNTVAAFLARRDVPALIPQEQSSAHGACRAQAPAEVLVLAGNSLPCTAATAAAALDAGAAHTLLITGGVGHSTQHLYDAVALVPELQHVQTAGRPEAEVMADMVLAYRHKRCNGASTAGGPAHCTTSDQCSHDSAHMLLECASTNCGDNAIKSVQLLQEQGMRPATVVLMQDPTMQTRSHASFQKALADAKWAPQLLSFAPFMPQVRPAPDGTALQYDEQLLQFQPLWPIERFVSLVMGEVPRLRNGPGGYGPNGRGFISAVEVPQEVEAAYARLTSVYGTREVV